MMLTAEQTALFRHNGFLKLPRPLPNATVALLKTTIEEHIQSARAPVARNGQDRVVRISDLWGRGTPFREALTGPEVLDPLESLLGPNIEMVLNRHNHATLRVAGDGTDYPHRDILQWSRSLVTVLFYLEETTLENGCTFVIPGSHLLPGIASLRIAEDETVRRMDILDQALPVPMSAGGLLALDSFVMHAAGTNKTMGTRMSMTAGYHSVDELSGVENPQRVLVRGTRIYLGNDARS